MKRAILFAFSAIAVATLPAFSVMPAIVYDQHFEQDVAFQYVNPCSGALMDITGHEEFDFHVVDNGKRANVSNHTRAHYTAIDGDGNTYVGHWTDNNHQSFPLQNGAFTSNISFKVHFVGQGGVEGFDLISRGHVTVTPGGAVPVDRFFYEIVCQ